MGEAVEITASNIQTVDFQPLVDILVPYLVVIIVSLGVLIALILVLLFAKGWQSNAR